MSSGLAECGRDVAAVVVVAVASSPRKDVKLATIKKRCGYCGLCKTVLRDWSGHCSRRPDCKRHPGTRTLSEQELSQLIQEYHAEVQDPAGAKLKRVEVAKARHAEVWQPRAPGAVEGHGPYRLAFGKHRGK